MRPIAAMAVLVAVTASGIAGYVALTNMAPPSTTTETAGGTATTTFMHSAPNPTTSTTWDGIQTVFVLQTVTFRSAGGTMTFTSCSTTTRVTVTQFVASAQTMSQGKTTTSVTLTFTSVVNEYSSTTTRSDCLYQVETTTTTSTPSK